MREGKGEGGCSSTVQNQNLHTVPHTTMPQIAYRIVQITNTCIVNFTLKV